MQQFAIIIVVHQMTGDGDNYNKYGDAGARCGGASAN